jgi:dTDP-4-amino-4,6-dideoxygalactose transaminase
MGDAGMIVTNDAAFAAHCEQLRNHGQGGTYTHHRVGGNFRMDTIQAAALQVKLRHLDDWSAARRAHAAQYDQLLADCDDVVTPTIREHNQSIFNQYVIRAEKRDELRAYLNENEIGSGVYYPLSLHQQECFADLGHKKGEFPVSEKAAGEVLALPVFPELIEDQITYVAEKIKAFYT